MTGGHCHFRKSTGCKKLYAVLLVCVTTAIGTFAQRPTTLANFTGPNGLNPLANLVQGVDGNFYGTTPYGGANNSSHCNNIGCGTIFRITPSGTLTTLYNFCAQTNCADGALPWAALLLANNGNFYGTTVGGGSDNGTVFEMTPEGKLTTLHSFNGTDGRDPEGALIQAANGKLYGVTTEGCASVGGSVFELTPDGTLTTLHCFGFEPDGAYPFGGLVQATNGSLYGTASEGGADGYGTVFEISTAGAFALLHSFDGTDGGLPYAALVQARNENLYGTTFNPGAVFEITPMGDLSVLSFFGSPGEAAALVQGNDGNLYGTTPGGGTHGAGGIFRITHAGTLTTLYNFCPLAGCADGQAPDAGLIQSTDGNFYGTTGAGGTAGDGTVFVFSVGLKPFVELVRTSGKVGASVTILGNELTGATSVTFNGTSATFKVLRSTEIKTTVPAGATTGPVTVTTSSGTLSSNTKFRVIGP
jgi:uncharacterized repeat protein (TIGR03803 family)